MRTATKVRVIKMMNDEAVGQKMGVRLGLAARSDQFSLPVIGFRKTEVPVWCAPIFCPTAEY